MKTFFHGLFMCQSMFCAIPSPYQGWDERAKNKVLLFLPLVGLEIGALWALLGWILSCFQVPGLLAAFLLCTYPYVVTGFLHLDGFMDVVDAVKSWRDLEKRREILKDSHVGSFSVIGIVLLILGQFVCVASGAWQEHLWVFVLLPVVSRCGSVLAVSLLKPMTTSQYAGNQMEKKFRFVPIVFFAGALAAGFLLDRIGSLALVGAAAGYLLALRRGYRSLEGMNGDIAGFALTISELAGLAVLAFL